MSIFDIFAKLDEKKKVPAGPPEYIAVGLGNPGKEYENTRHNIGFISIDAVAEKMGIKIEKLKFKSLIGEGVISGKKVLFMKPSTYMNLSGEAVRDAMEFYKIPPEQVCVIFDDISLPVGKMRIKRKGSDGGHNGIKNIIYHAKSDNFPRIKIGVGEKPAGWDLKDWVLCKFSKEDKELLSAPVNSVFDALTLIIEGKTDEAMNRYN